MKCLVKPGCCKKTQGALAFLGSSTYTYWDEDDVLERSYFDLLFSGVQPPVGISTMTDAGLAAVELAYPDMALYYCETYNILGDPAVKLFLQPDLPTFTLQPGANQPRSMHLRRGQLDR